MFFWNSLAFSMIQQMLAIWSLVPLPFLNPAWTSESSRLKPNLKNFELLLCWRVKWVQLCGNLKILWHCLSLGFEWNWPFPVLWPLPAFNFKCCQIQTVRCTVAGFHYFFQGSTESHQKTNSWWLWKTGHSVDSFGSEGKWIVSLYIPLATLKLPRFC